MTLTTNQTGVVSIILLLICSVYTYYHSLNYICHFVIIGLIAVIGILILYNFGHHITDRFELKISFITLILIPILFVYILGTVGAIYSLGLHITGQVIDPTEHDSNLMPLRSTLYYMKFFISMAVFVIMFLLTSVRLKKQGATN